MEWMLLLAGLGLTVIAAIVVYASMRRAGVPSSGRELEPQPPGDMKAPWPDDRDRAVVPPEKLILRGLQALLERSPDDAFVIFEHPPTKRFVQFMRNDAGVTLDFPLIELTDDERNRAKALFDRYGLPVAQFSGEAGSVDIYQADFGTDLARASQVAAEIFRKVFALEGEFPLYVKTE